VSHGKKFGAEVDRLAGDGKKLRMEIKKYRLGV